jgi:putative hydrolase of the HAD superfamily
MSQQSKTKAVLFDVDGVVVHKSYFSRRFSRDFGVPEEKIREFFQNEMEQCIVGKADLKVEVSKYLKDWKWGKPVDELLSYWFNGEKEIDQKVLEVVKKIREKEINCYLASDQEKYRADFLLNNLDLGKLFDGHFFSCELGYEKSSQEFFEKVIQELGFAKPDEIMFWDDDPKKVEVAKSVGIDARLYQNFEDFEREILKFVEI